MTEVNENKQDLYDQELQGVMEENDGYTISDDEGADKAIEYIKKAQHVIESYEKKVKDKIARMKDQMEKFITTQKARIDFYSFNLRMYFDEIDPNTIRTTKAGSKIADFPAGKLTMNEKLTFDLDKKDANFVDFMEDGGYDKFIKTTKEINWAELKKAIVIDEDNIVIEESGLVLDDQFIKFSKDEEFKIK